jgi:hypothetical protein
MENNADQATKLAELKKQLEDLAGQEIDVSPEQLIKLTFAIGLQSTADGEVISTLLIPPGKSCSRARLLDASGHSSTDATGQRSFLLSDFLCIGRYSFAEPIHLVATPRSVRPSYVTAVFSLVPDPNTPGVFNDLKITIFAWQPNGTAAPNVAFDWRCRLVSYEIIF